MYVSVLWGSRSQVISILNILFVPAPFAEKTVFPLSNSLSILAKIQMTVNVSLFLGSQFYIDLCLSVYQHYSALITDYCSFVESFEVRKCERSKFLLFKIVLAMLAPLNFHMNFRTSLSIPAKKPAGVLMGIALNLYINLEGIVILTEFNLRFIKHRIFIYLLFRFPLIFFKEVCSF